MSAATGYDAKTIRKGKRKIVLCECGYKSRTSGSMAVARNASREHAKFHAMQPRAAVSGPT